MSTCPPNAVTSVQNVATGNITCYDANGNIIGTPIIVNSPIPVGPGNQCIIPSTTKIVTNLATNYYQCKNQNEKLFFSFELQNLNPSSSRERAGVRVSDVVIIIIWPNKPLKCLPIPIANYL